MVALIVVFLIATGFGIAGGLIGYSCGFDKGWESAEDCFEEEIKNVSSESIRR